MTKGRAYRLWRKATTLDKRYKALVAACAKLREQYEVRHRALVLLEVEAKAAWDCYRVCVGRKPEPTQPSPSPEEKKRVLQLRKKAGGLINQARRAVLLDEKDRAVVALTDLRAWVDQDLRAWLDGG